MDFAFELRSYLPKVDDCNLHLSLVQFCLFYWCACMFIRRPLERSCVVLILFWFRLSWSTVLDFLVLPSFCFVLSCRSPKHKARLGYLVLWYPCSPQDPSCSPWELWPLEASVGPKWFCGTGSSGSTLSAIDVAPCVFGFSMTAGQRVLFKPNGSEIWHPSCLSQTAQTFQDHAPHPTNYQKLSETIRFGCILMVVSRPGHGMEILSKPESGKGLFKPNGQGLQEISNLFSRSRV